MSLTTLARWRAWWQVAFPLSPFWRASRGHFQTPVPAEGLPAALLERFRGGEEERLVAMLRFLSPITSPSRRCVAAD